MYVYRGVFLTRKGVMAVCSQVAITLHLPHKGRHLFCMQSPIVPGLPQQLPLHHPGKSPSHGGTCGSWASGHPPPPTAEGHQALTSAVALCSAGAENMYPGFSFLELKGRAKVLGADHGEIRGLCIYRLPSRSPLVFNSTTK